MLYLEAPVREKNIVRGITNRFLQWVAMYAPSNKIRKRMHQWRGVKIGAGGFIMQETILETSHPEWISIGNHVDIGIRCVVMAHFRGREQQGKSQDDFAVIIEDDVYIGHCVVILPNVRIGRGSVVTAGSVVTRNIPPMMVVQGNPAKPIARCGIPLGEETRYEDFIRNLKPLKSVCSTSM